MKHPRRPSRHHQVPDRARLLVAERKKAARQARRKAATR